MRALALSVVVGVTSFGSVVSGDDGMRCDRRLVSVGDSEATVLERCGPPTSADTERPVRRRRNGLVARCVIDRWTYDRGPTEFVRTLRFEDGVLTSVDVGDYGGR